MRIRADADDARQSVRDMDDCPPLREAGAHAMVLGEAIPEPVEPLGYCFAGRARERLCADVDLDAGKDVLLRKNLGEGCAVGALLPDGLVLHDDAADELRPTRRGEEHFPVGASALFGRRDAERVEPLRQGGDGLVGCEDPLAVGDQCRRDALKIVAHSSNPYLLWYVS